ncbi:hypothetical protein MKW98_011259 [Papaver atlanticum]|uniref:Uncharacterized protein n=1 Tax=Papaver atlanticum TaxID=357466 RepID=A0AAD4SVK1_9MAGN|nr:hypothetical protein MKW98_011259 [Papaver atlanticum]
MLNTVTSVSCIMASEWNKTGAAIDCLCEAHMLVTAENDVLILHRDKVADCARHFVGDGGTINGINENNTMEPSMVELATCINVYSDGGAISDGALYFSLLFRY